jgi:hypothetical protein
VKELQALAPYYVPELELSEDKEAGAALINIAANMLKLIIDRLNRAPEKNFAAFLDLLGIQLLPAQPASVPVTFYLSEGATENVLISERSQMAAGELVFETEKSIVAAHSQLVNAYSVDTDCIFAAPPNVVSGELAIPFSTTLTFDVLRGEKKVFLDDVSGLNKEEVIKIEDERVEYAIVSDVSETNVDIVDKVLNDHDKGTAVRKVTTFALFDGKNIQAHILYLGHKDLFNIKGEAAIALITGAPSASKLGNPNIVQWEYWGEAIRTEDTEEIKEIDWHPLSIEASKTSISLQKTGSGEITEREINGVTSRWIRCKAKTTKIAIIQDVVLDTILIGGEGGVQRSMRFYSLPPKAIRGIDRVFGERLAKAGIRSIETLLKFTGRVDDLAEILSGEHNASKYRERAENILENAEKRILDKEYEEEEEEVAEGILPDMAFYNDVPLDLTLRDSEEFKTPVYPFGTVPRRYDTFYIASQECFSKKNTKIGISCSLSQSGQVGTDGITLSWEYWNGKGWTVIKDFTDTTEDFTRSEGVIEFTCPGDIQPNQVSGQENYWVRVRIVSGDYGKEEFKKVNGGTAEETWEIKTDNIIPPELKKLTVTYTLTPQNVQHCLSYNNLEFKDVTEESKTEKKTFKPFQSLDDEHPTLYLGFDKKIEKGPISIFFSLEEQEFPATDMPKVEWYYYSQDNKWIRLDVLDDTRDLTRTGAVAFIVPSDSAKTYIFGDDRCWLKAVDIKNKFQTQAPEVNGIYLNTTAAIQAESIEDEIIGSSDGTANQSFEFVKNPVIEEEIWVNEKGTLLDEEKEKLIAEMGEDSVLEKQDENGKTTEVWVRWQAVEDFFDSEPKSRHYVVDRAAGAVTFGDGIDGMVPPVGKDSIKAAYQVGGGEEGNVGASEISTLKTAIPFVDRVTNPEAAGGGADKELLEDAMERGPWVVKHRNRAVTAEDFEWLARQASREVVRVKCMGAEAGSITVIIVPMSEEDEPAPTLELKKVVDAYLSERCSPVISLRVEGPEYIEVSVRADVFPTSMDMAPLAEKEALTRLKEFLHPLTGGEEGKGWEFGRLVCLSDIYALLEGITEIDHVEHVTVTMMRAEQGKRTAVTPGTWIPGGLICSGEHKINVQFKGAG